jgi:hypothetical protein
MARGSTPVALLVERDHRREPMSDRGVSSSIPPHDERGLRCEFAGHLWQDAGGGLEICPLCFAERWSEERRDMPDD